MCHLKAKTTTIQVNRGGGETGIIITKLCGLRKCSLFGKEVVEAAVRYSIFYIISGRDEIIMVSTSLGTGRSAQTSGRPPTCSHLVDLPANTEKD